MMAIRRICIDKIQQEQRSNHTTRSAWISRVDEAGRLEQRDHLHFSYEGLPSPVDQDAGPFLLALIHDAMREDRDIHIEGSVCTRLLEHLGEFQRAWSLWVPETYKVVSIQCTKRDDEPGTSRKTVCAFSGGVDGTFSVLSHKHGLLPHDTKSIAFCTLVHGFDVPLRETPAFEQARLQALELLSTLDIPLRISSTNLREVQKTTWEHTFATSLAAVLHCFDAEISHGLIGSSQPYNRLVFPWGSNPVTDSMLSTNRMSIWHDGSGFTRSDKVAFIAKHPVAAKALRVCWAGPMTGKNCGKCEKCARTALNFLAANSPVPECLAPTQLRTNLKHVSIGNKAVFEEWQMLYGLSRQSPLAQPYLHLIRRVLWRYRLKSLFPKYVQTLPGRIERRLSLSRRKGQPTATPPANTP